MDLKLEGDSTAQRMGWGEKIILLFFYLLLAAVKVGYSFRFRADSDEPQHLHVVWAWTQGLVQYRDVFDNHSPLFHLMMAPVLQFFGERGDILLYMRLAVLPFYFGSLACLFFIVRFLSASVRVAAWSTLVIGFWPVFMLTSTEFRTDCFWMTAWFAAVAVWCGGPLTWKRWVWVGVLVGLTFGGSMKTTLLLTSFVMAAVPTVLWRGYRDGFGFLQGWGRNLLAFLGGAMVVPLLTIAYFASHHALDAMRYCVLEHNVVPGFRQNDHFQFLQHVAFALGGGVLIHLVTPSVPVAMRRTILLGTGVLAIGLLESYWPLVTAQGYLPLVPLILAALIPTVLDALQGVPQLALQSPGGLAVRTLFVAGLATVLLAKDPPTENRLAPFNKGLEVLLRLSRPDDYVMDAKGETIFRHRPFYYVLEGVTRRRMRLGLIEDTIPNDCDKTNTCIFINNRMSRRNRSWVQKNYVEVADRVWVAGVLLPPSGQVRTFRVSRAATYRMVSPEGSVVCRVNGVECQGAIALQPGVEYRLECEPHTPVAVVFAQAVEAGLNPFTTHERVVLIDQKGQM